jgi:hypothetical protein
MERTGADFTNTFRLLADVPMPSKSGTASRSQAAAEDGSSTPGPAAAAADGAEAPAGAAAAAAAAGGDSSVDDEEFGGVLPLLLGQLASPSEMAAGSKPSMPLENLQVGAACVLWWCAWHCLLHRVRE